MYRIPSCNIDTLKEKIEKLNRKAVRLNVAPITMIVTEDPEREAITGENVFGERVIVGYRTYYLVDLPDATAVSLSGYTLIGIIDHTAGEGNIITSLIDGIDLSEYRESDALCQHCNMVRRRNQTYIVFFDNVRSQVGSSCLQDFIGNDAAQLAARAQIIREVRFACADSEFDPGIHSHVSENLEEYLTMVAACIRELGRISRGDIHEGRVQGQATADTALEKLSEKNPKYQVIPIAQDSEVARATITWITDVLAAKDAEKRSDYEHNLVVISTDGVVSHKHIGIAASAIIAHKRYMADQVKREASNFVGTIGERNVFTLTVVTSFSWESDYGVCFRYIMNDGNGNVFTWKTGNYSYEDGKTYTVKATIKDHTEYHGVKQTEITRLMAFTPKAKK